MYVDVTPEFRLVVSSLVNRAEELGLSLATKDKSRILTEKVTRYQDLIFTKVNLYSQSGLRRQAEKIVQTVRSLSELLKEQRSRYLDNHAFAGGGAMTETERNQVECQATLCWTPPWCDVGRQCDRRVTLAGRRWS